MGMRVGFGTAPLEIMVVLMVDVMPMSVAVLHWLVRVEVLMALTDVQPHADCHQRSGQPESP